MTNFKFLKRGEIESLPKKIGVYCLKNKKEILYIGKASNLRERVKNHFQQPGCKDYLFLEKIKKIGYIETDSEIEALILEANLIKKHQPKFNVIWKDDKNYFFVAKTKEEFPRIFWTHQKKSKNDAEFVGPFVDGKALKSTLKILRKIFPYRSCRKIPNRPCLWYHLNLCPASCLLKSKIVNEIKAIYGYPISIDKLKNECQRDAKNLMKTIEKGKNPVLKELKKEMELHSKRKEFEEAAKIRDRMKALEKVFLHSKIFEIEKPKEEWKKIELKLKKMLETKKEISRIEAFDVSNIKGKMATGSMVTFVDGRENKNFYRRFKIKFEKKPNDIAMLQEVLKRRFLHREWRFPDLILIDGGKAHLNVALKSLKNIKRRPKILSLAKKEKRLFIEEKKPIFLKDLENEVSNFILKVNGEAHRFAISYHKKLRKKFLLGK